MRATPTAVTFFAILISLGVGARPAAAQNAFRELFPVVPLADAVSATAASPAIEIQNVDLLQPTAPPPAKPEHTGLSALVHATGSDFAAFPRRPSTWVILAAGLGAAAIAHPFDDNIADHEFSKGAKHFFVLGKYLGQTYVQAGVAAGLYITGRYIVPPAEGEPRTNKLSHLGFDLIRANIVSGVLVQGIKIAVRRDRPNGNCCAFPSGHAATAFATASVLERHFGYRGAWPTLVGASYVAISRLADHQHFLSDVVFGSALGIATGWTVVGRHGRENFTLLPVPVKGGVAVIFARNGDRRTP
jgi:membrane-associated phospholipid phosphatase